MSSGKDIINALVYSRLSSYDNGNQAISETLELGNAFFETVDLVMIIMDIKSFHIHVSGRVQGVAFRHYTKLHADRTGVTGWVRNRRDGTVEAVICGTKEQVEHMITWLHTGSPAAAVTGVSVSELLDPETYSNFDIIY